MGDVLHAKFDEVAADLKKFREAILRVRSYNPTGVVLDEVLSMSISVHLEKRNTMSFEEIFSLRAQWRNYLAYKSHQSHPKFFWIGEFCPVSWWSV